VVARDRAIFHGRKKVALLTYKALLANTHILFQLNVGIFKLSLFPSPRGKKIYTQKKNATPPFLFLSTFQEKTSKIG